MGKTIELTWINENEDEVTAEFPAVNAVCDDCKGEGTVLAPGMRFHAYSEEEFAREFTREEQREYFKRGGMYDVSCPTCKENKVVPVPNPKAFNAEQKALFAQYQAWKKQSDREDAEYAWLCESERRMGC